jgi:NifB/MoaA-like Fe-S oxidoreductase
MVRSFERDFESLRKRLARRPPSQPARLNGTVMTGTLFAPVMKRLLDDLNARFGTGLHTVAVENLYFGGDVSVAGLLTGGDYLAAREKVRGDFVIIPGSSLKTDEAIMLDGMTHTELEAQLGLPVHAPDFKAFARLLSKTEAGGQSLRAGDRVSQASGL